MHKEYLQQAGLSEGEAIVYDYLLKNGECSAGDVIEKTNLKRGNTYNILESLVVKGIIVQQDKNKVAHFHVEDPRALLNLIDRNKEMLETKRKAVEGILPSLISQYQLTTNRPVVSYYEGREGFMKVLNDPLTSKTEVLQYCDVEIFETTFKKENDEHVHKRGNLNIVKKLIVLDTEFTRNLYRNLEEKAESHVHAIPPNEKTFDVALFVYDGKVSYLTLVKDKVVGVIIEDQRIYEMHRHLFMILYEKSKSILE